MKASELTYEERWLYMPRWKKALYGIVGTLCLMTASIDSISF